VTKKTLRDIDVQGKTILARLDWNVPIEDGAVTDAFRIEATRETLEYLWSRDAKIIITSHLGRPDGKVNPEFSLEPAAKKASEIFGREVKFVHDCIGPDVEQAVAGLGAGEMLLLENVRFHPEEEANDPAVAKRLADLAEIFVYDAFASYRAHASTVGVTKYLPAYAGLLMERAEEIAGIVTEAPRRPELLSTAMVVPGVGKTLLGALGTMAADPEREVTIKVRPGAAQVIGTAVPNILGPQAPQRYKVEIPPSADQFRAQVQGDLGSVFLILGIVALIVGVLGIANSGLVAVMQRTREFGVRRALGARARHIAWQVLCEAGVLGLMGGLAGLTVGLVVIVVTAAEKGWTPALDPVVTAVAPFLGLATGVLAGLYPAWRASRIEPVEALRA